MENSIKRVGIIFSGGPAPAANAVISAAAVSFLKGIESSASFMAIRISLIMIPIPIHCALMNTFVYLITRICAVYETSVASVLVARTNPGKGITQPTDLSDAQKTAKLKRVYEGLQSSRWTL